MSLKGDGSGLTEIVIDELDDILDVVITAPTSGQTLQFQNNVWVNTTAAAVGGTGTVTSAAVSGNNGITVAGSPINTEGVITLGLGNITPLTINTSSGTFSGKLTGVAAAFSGKVSADAGLNTTTVSAASIGVTGDINAATGRVLASAATFTGKLTAAAAIFSGLVSADSGIKTSTVSADSIGVTGDINAGAGRVTASAMTMSGTPTNSTDVATKGYVDNLFAGFSPRSSCRLAGTSNLNVTYLNGASGVGGTLTNAGSLAAFSLDGINAAAGDRVLIKNQSTDLQNGIYTVTTVGSGIIAWVLTRATDYDQSAEVFEGTYTDISEGNTQAETQWIMNKSGVITMGTTSITFAELLVASQTVTLTGDVSGSGTGSFATTINPGVVTDAKLTDIPSKTIKSNITTASAQPSNNTLGNILDSVLGSAAGKVAYRGAEGWVASALGGTGTVTKVSGGAGLIFSTNPITATGDIALDTSAQNAWTAQQGFSIATLTDVSAVTWNLKSQQVAKLTRNISGTAQIQDPTNMVAGNTYILIVTKGSANTATLTFTSAYRWPGSTSPTLTSTSGAVDVFTFVCMASALYGSFAQNYTAP